MALNNLAIRLSEVGQRQEALGPAQEAADLYRELAAKAPDAYRPDLAMALNNLANCLSEVGQRQEALGPAQEAADLYRELAAKAPDAYRPDLAMALNNLAIRLSEVGQRQAALGAGQEAADLYRELAAKAPDAYRPALASALNNLANRLSAVGQRQEALGPATRTRAAAKARRCVPPNVRRWRIGTCSASSLPAAFVHGVMPMCPNTWSGARRSVGSPMQNCSARSKRCCSGCRRSRRARPPEPEGMGGTRRNAWREE